MMRSAERAIPRSNFEHRRLVRRQSMAAIAHNHPSIQSLEDGQDGKSVEHEPKE